MTRTDEFFFFDFRIQCKLKIKIKPRFFFTITKGRDCDLKKLNMIKIIFLNRSYIFSEKLRFKNHMF